MPSTLRSAAGAGVSSSAQCVDLYVEKVMVPRVVLLSLLVGLAVVAAFVARRCCCCCRRRRLPSPPGSVNDAAITPSKPQHQDTQLLAWFARLLCAGAVWTAIFLLSFQSYDFLSSGGGGALSRPRVVFSFTTISEGITKLRPTLDALVTQDGPGFDAIYVIVPRAYRGTPLEIPAWLVPDARALNRSDFFGIGFATGASAYHTRVRIVQLDVDFGPASKVLGALLVEHEPDTVIVYGDDDRVYPPQLCERALHHGAKFPHDAVAVLGGWISAEDALYCGRSLEVGANRVSFVGGAGGVAVKRKFFGAGRATLAAFAVVNMSKACFLGDDFYLSHVLSTNGVARRLVYDSCWTIKQLGVSYPRGGLSLAPSAHPGGANVEHYQQCIRELGRGQDLSGDGEFGWLFMAAFSHVWGAVQGLSSWLRGDGFVPC
ncbi:hypothetical protein PybrP1_003553 [[Pythium] brassicae (nom. inval.)]|nr:hypothetical protein PybrP1_003553 [[Pythium] brassicae (nom. inval.)]